MTYTKKISSDIYFFKDKLDKQDYRSQPAVNIVKDGDKYNVFRTSIYYSKYEKRIITGNGWNLYKNLNHKEAISAARSALKYLK